MLCSLRSGGEPEPPRRCQAEQAEALPLHITASEVNSQQSVNSLKGPKPNRKAGHFHPGQYYYGYSHAKHQATQAKSPSLELLPLNDVMRWSLGSPAAPVRGLLGSPAKTPCRCFGVLGDKFSGLRATTTPTPTLTPNKGVLPPSMTRGASRHASTQARHTAS